MGTKVNSNYEDLITYTRASKGYALRPVSYGTELVTNGDGSSTDGWTTANTTLSIVSEALRVTATGSSATASQGVSTVVGKVYKFSASLNGGTAVDQIRVGTAINTATGGGSLTSTGEFVFVATTSTTYITLKAGDVSGLYADFDNISVKEVLFDQPDGTLTLFEHPDGVPRVEYDADGNRLGLLVEEQRVNLALNSNDLAADWSEQATTATLTQDVVGPDGEISAWTLVDDNSGGTASTVGIQENLTFASGGTYAISIFAKADGLNWIYFSNVLFDGGTDLNYFDLENVALGASNPNTCFIEDVGNGWRRCTQVMTTTTDLSGIIVIKVANSDGDITVDLDGTSSVQLYGFQIEAGSFPTSYIKNEGTPSGATRSADVAFIPVADFGYNQSEGTVFVEASSYKGIPKLLHLNDGSDSNRAQITASASNVAAYVQATGDSGSFISVTGAPTVPFKVALGIETNDMGLTVNGSSVSTDTSQNVPVSITTLNIGSGATGGSVGQAHIKSIKYYPRRLTNAQLQELTS